MDSNGKRNRDNATQYSQSNARNILQTSYSQRTLYKYIKIPELACYSWILSFVSVQFVHWIDFCFEYEYTSMYSCTLLC